MGWILFPCMFFLGPQAKHYTALTVFRAKREAVWERVGFSRWSILKKKKGFFSLGQRKEIASHLATSYLWHMGTGGWKCEAPATQLVCVPLANGPDCCLLCFKVRPAHENINVTQTCGILKRCTWNCESDVMLRASRPLVIWLRRASALHPSSAHLTY